MSYLILKSLVCLNDLTCKSGVSLGCFPQSSRKSLEHRLCLVVVVRAVRACDVQRDASVEREAPEEFLEELCIHRSAEVASEITFEDQESPA